MIFPLFYQVSLFYTLGSAVQHYWCNINTDENLAIQLSSNPMAFVVGIGLFVIGELINLYHHSVLASLRPAGSSSGYLVPQAGLFRYVVCPHYFG